MKSTESLDVAGQPVDSPSTAGETGLTGDTSTLNNKRRRLIRSAVALAPVVLTLRSGALAAASCTGARTVSTTLDSNGRVPTSVGALANDVCYKTSAPNGVAVCPVHSTTKLENPPGEVTRYPYNSTTKKCGNSTTGILSGGTNVAILSGTAASSFAI